MQSVWKLGLYEHIICRMENNVHRQIVMTGLIGQGKRRKGTPYRGRMSIAQHKIYSSKKQERGSENVVKIAMGFRPTDEKYRRDKLG